MFPDGSLIPHKLVNVKFPITLGFIAKYAKHSTLQSNIDYLVLNIYVAHFYLWLGSIASLKDIPICNIPPRTAYIYNL
jgi:hypothetical protein